MRSLTRLALNGTAVSSGLKHLTSLKELRKLDIGHCVGVRDQDIEHLSALSKLEELRAASTGIQGTTLAALQGLSNLRCLDVAFTTIAATAAITAVAKLTQLTSLNADVNINFTKPAPAFLAELSRLTQLQQAFLYGHCLTGAALALLDLPELIYLGARSVQAVRAGLTTSNGCCWKRPAVQSSLPCCPCQICAL